MSVIYIDGGWPLSGELSLQGSKNTVLPMLAASILNRGSLRLFHCPQISDVEHMLVLLEQLGCHIRREGDCIEVNASRLNSDQVAPEYGKQMRSSFFLLGPMLGRMKRASAPYPGGCIIGARPIDIHLEAFQKMQVEIEEDGEMLYLSTRGLKGNEICLRFPSVGATENIVMAAVLAEGTTCIRNAAREPEVTELCLLLKKMGARITGEGTDTLVIQGVERLHDAEYTVKGDRIAGGTYLAAAFATRGSLTLKTDCISHMESTLRVLEAAGARLSVGADYVTLMSAGKIKAIKGLVTETYPGFPTDMQSQMMAVLACAGGDSSIEERIFESRFRICEELKKMGARIAIQGNIARLQGVPRLFGTIVEARELRGGAALVIAALEAEGESCIRGIPYIERGYENICDVLAGLGAQIRKEE